MFKKCVFGILILISNFVSSQNTAPSFYFDTLKFKELQALELDCFYDTDSNQVCLKETEIGYQKTINLVNSFYVISYQYYKTTTSIHRTGKFFQMIPVGIHYEYYDDGRLARAINFDKDYLISIDSLASIVKSSFQKDILDSKEKVVVTRGIYNESRFYSVKFPINKSENSPVRELIINGKTGDLITDMTKEPTASTN